MEWEEKEGRQSLREFKEEGKMKEGEEKEVGGGGGG